MMSFWGLVACSSPAYVALFRIRLYAPSRLLPLPTVSPGVVYIVLNSIVYSASSRTPILRSGEALSAVGTEPNRIVLVLNDWFLP